MAHLQSITPHYRTADNCGVSVCEKSTIHYHGMPVWGDGGSVHRIAVTGAGAFVSYAHPEQMSVSLKYADYVGADNGAYSKWRKGLAISWPAFYAWLMRFYHHDKLKFFVIPDDIEGGEAENDRLIRNLPSMFRDKATPTWHLHESINRLVELCREWPRVCFGSSGQYAAIRTQLWHSRMREAFETIYCKHNFKTLIHGLRMLDGRVLGNYPLATADSTNLACNVPKFEKKYPEITRQVREADYARGLNEKELKALILRTRCAVLKNAIESVTPPTPAEWVGRVAA